MLGILNARESLKKKLSDKFDLFIFNSDIKDFPKLDGLFIDWSEGPPELFALQAALMDYYAKKRIPIAIFDRFMAIQFRKVFGINIENKQIKFV